MQLSGRYAIGLAAIAALLVVAACSASAEPDPAAASTPVSSTPPPTSTPAPLATPPPPSEVDAEPVLDGVLQDEFCVVDVVAPDTLSVHSGPSSDDPTLDELTDGECRIFPGGDSIDGWLEIVRVIDNEDVRGWVNSNFITPVRAPIDPDAPLVTITVSVVVEQGLASPSSEATLDAFRLVVPDGLVVGSLNVNGQITIPAGLDLRQSRVEAEFANDPFCAWTGQLRFEGFDNRYTAELEAICA